MDTDGVSEWICTAYQNKAPEFCKKYLDNQDPFMV